MVELREDEVDVVVGACIGEDAVQPVELRLRRVIAQAREQRLVE